MPKGLRIGTDLYLQPNGTVYWRVERCKTIETVRPDGTVEKKTERRVADGTAPSEEDAKIARANAIKFYKANGFMPTGKDAVTKKTALSKTVADALEEWFVLQKQRSLAADTRRSARKTGCRRLSTLGVYRRLAQRYVIPVIGSVLVLEFNKNTMSRLVTSSAVRGLCEGTQGQIRFIVAEAIEGCTSVGGG